MKETISILGCGWIGEALAIELVNRHYPVKTSTRSKYISDELSDISTQHFCIDIDHGIYDISFFKADVLVIAIPSKNIEGFKELLKNLNTNIKTIIFISSTSVYKPSKKPIDEQSERNKNALAQIEDLFLDSDYDTIILRFAGLYGYNRKPVNFISKVRKMSNPNGCINLVHRDDCITIIAALIEQKYRQGIFNVCASTHPKRKIFYTKLAKLNHCPTPIFDEDGEEIMKQIDNTKIKENLAYTFTHDDLSLLYDKDYEY